MPPPSPDKAISTFQFGPYDADHYRDIKRRNIIRLLLTYLLPLVLLSIYFIYQNNAIVVEGRRIHLKGIAHEIINPLAIISEEAGLMKDFMNQDFGQNLKREDMIPHLENIHESVFRCRDITRKLLGFVRRTEMDLKLHGVHEILDGVLEGILGHEMAVFNVTA